MRALSFLACALSLVVGCGGEEESASGLFPASGFVGRSLRVEVNGDNTSFDSGTAVSFGPGVTVNEVAISSPTVLFANVTIGDDATAGLNDVTVTNDGDTLTMAAAFELRNPVAITTIGTPAQGGKVSLVIENLDLENLFDSSVDPQTGLFNTTATSGAGTTLVINDVTEFEIAATAFFDVDAAPTSVAVISDGLTSPGGTLEVEARTAVPIVSGTPATGTLDGSALFEITATEAAILAATIGTSEADVTPTFDILPASGRWADAGFTHFATDNTKVAAGDKLYYVVSDADGLDGYAFQLAVDEISIDGVTPVAEAEPNNNDNAAQTVAGPLALLGSTLADDTDLDFYEITLTTGQTLTVRTTAGANGGSDTEIAMFDTDGTTELDRVDFDFADTVVFTAPADGTYFVTVEPSAFALFFGYAPNNDPYDLLITVE
ncbi:MAG: PPC domain-containing protein [Deltaproteobacteria bacterium]|nr:PPC domain-containing protein [Deltaproteobacteria bacterium]